MPETRIWAGSCGEGLDRAKKKSDFLGLLMDVELVKPQQGRITQIRNISMEGSGVKGIFSKGNTRRCLIPLETQPEQRHSLE